MQERVATEPASAAQDDILIRSHAGPGVALLTLNRPRARNGLSLALIERLGEDIAKLSADPHVCAVVIAANGPAFCAGHDLKELTAHRADADGGKAFFARTMSACAAMMQAIVASPKPFICSVEGIATAAGCQLVATCDLAIAGATAQFCTPGVNIGLFCSTPMVALSRNVARKQAMEMLLLGDMIDAERAEAFGLVNRVVADGAARDAALDMARMIAGKPRATVAVGKAAFYRQIEAPLAAAYEDTACVMVDNLLQQDAGEGIAAFLEKRSPRWPDKA